MGLYVNGKPLKSMSYNGLVIEEQNLKVDILDFSDWDTGYFEEILEDGSVCSFIIEFDQSGKPIKFIDSDEHETTIIWETTP